MPAKLPFIAIGEDEVELTVVDLGVARALWEGVPIGRLLARVRLFRDERDLVEEADRASGAELNASWDVLLARLLASSPHALDRVKRAVARHARAASDEGATRASDPAVAALVYALLSAGDADASCAEGAAEAGGVEEAVMNACSRFDDRFARAKGFRGVAFEACLELARIAYVPAWPLSTYEQVVPGMTAAPAQLYPWVGEDEIPVEERRAVMLDRVPMETALVAPIRASTMNARLMAEAGDVVTKHGALLLVATREPRSSRAAPSLPPNSWQPTGPNAAFNAATLADALERGSITAPRARVLLNHGGDTALDAIGKEMLEVSLHPFASAVFAEILAPIARERDVVRLVSYFAIAPDPSAAAHALDLCANRDVVGTVLRTWLETMLPADGAVAATGDDPDTSTGARVASCIAALRPYPALYQCVRPLLKRLSEAPPGPGSPST
ncbi:MAG: hypothetical protein U0270_32705 [Labilithrix sp.]